ncbi:hypothetical protein ACOSP7_002438 [Xanthoceras sorbifolium]
MVTFVWGYGSEMVLVSRNGASSLLFAWDKEKENRDFFPLLASKWTMPCSAYYFVLNTPCSSCSDAFSSKILSFFYLV